MTRRVIKPPLQNRAGDVSLRWAFLSVTWILQFLVLSSACQPDLLSVPRLSTQEAQSGATATATSTPTLSLAPTTTPGSEAAQGTSTSSLVEEPSNPVVTLWVNETSDSHAEVLDKMTSDFSARSGIQVELILVSDRLLPELVNTAVVSETLPDLILHPVEYTVGWAEKGILDPQAATGVLEELGRNTFEVAALEMVTVDGERGTIAALPSTSWPQLIIYRADWFSSLGLAPPDTYDRMLAAAEAIFQPETIQSGLVVPTDSNLVTTQQVFEHMAAANGCELADRKGEVTILHPACLEALDFYHSLINQYSPIGVQTDTSALNAYLAGRTGIIMASPSVLPQLAGLDNDFKPTCLDCEEPGFLAQNSGFIRELTGSGEFASPASFHAITSLGITTAADIEAATAFARYWFEDGYWDWLSVDPERKTPARWGTVNGARANLEAWERMPMTADGPRIANVYGSSLVAQLSNIASSGRWGFPQGQGALVTSLYEEVVLSPLLQEMLSGYFTSSQTIIEMYRAVVALIPDYAYPIDVEPVATPQ